MITRVFKSGNSQAVRLPKELRVDAEQLEITRHGDALILRPVGRTPSLVQAFDALGQIGDDFLPEGREQEAVQEREAL